MRNLVSVLGVLMALFGAGVGNTVRAAGPLEPVAPQSTSGNCPTLQPAPGWVCVGGAWLPPIEPIAPQPPIPIPPQLISVGELVMFTLTEQDSYQTFELTAPSDGTLLVSVDDRSSGIGIFINGEYPLYSGFATHDVVAGETILIEVWLTLAWDAFGLPDTPVVLTTSLSAVPLILPPRCLTFKPGPDWVCVGGGDWVPPDHAAAAGAFTFPQPALVPPVAPAQPAPQGGGATGCPSVSPGPDWVCVAGGNWVRPDHPLAVSTPAISPPPSLPAPPTPPTGCTTPDPFAGIPGMRGVCIGNNNWVPVGHPLAGGG